MPTSCMGYGYSKSSSCSPEEPCVLPHSAVIGPYGLQRGTKAGRQLSCRVYDGQSACFSLSQVTSLNTLELAM